MMKWILALFGVFGSILAWLVLTWYPQMPTPNGQYAVGVTQFEVSQDKHWIQISAWYPGVKDESAARFSYLPEWLASSMSEQTGMPVFENDLPSYSFIDLKAVEQSWPVLIFNHGYGGFPRQNMTQFEELASQGFIVLSVGHPRDSIVLQRSNGELVPQSREYAIHDLPSERLNSMAQAQQKMVDAQTLSQWQQASNELTQQLNISRLPTWLENNQLLLSKLDSINQGKYSAVLEGRLDLSKVGAFGHSFGGIVTTQLLQQAPMLKAGVNLDGPQVAFDASQPLNKPACFIYGELQLANTRLEKQVGFNDALLNNSSTWACSVIFADAAHMNFSDLNYITPLKYVGILGPAEAQSFGSALSSTLVGFFGRHLNQEAGWQPGGIRQSVTVVNNQEVKHAG